MTDRFNLWKNYADKTKESPMKPFVMRAVGFVTHKGNALDLGSGGLRDPKYFLEQGFEHVTALDESLVANDIAQTLPPEKFSYIESSFETYQFPENAYDFVNAQYALPFTHPAHFDRVFKAIEASLREKGIFAGQLFGTRDEWAQKPNMTFHTREQAEQLFEHLILHVFDEQEREGQDMKGRSKHWHTFNFISERRRP